MNSPVDVGPVRERHRFDEAALERYLSANVPGFTGPLDVRQFAGGQSNPTFFLKAGGRGYVLRKKPPGKLLPSAHAVDREYRVLAALSKTDVPVPRVHLLCEDDAVIGQAFYLMDWVEGRIFRDPTLPALPPQERSAIYDAMNDTLARLHRVDYRAVGLESYGKPGNYFQRQIARWIQQYEASKTEQIESFDALVEWLPRSIPAGDETTIAHGDFRLENMIFHPSESRVLAVIDWELSTLGHPLADLGYNVMGYFMPAGSPQTLGKIDASSGIPAVDAYVRRYCERVGRPVVVDLDFYVAFAMFRLAAIAQGIAMRARTGTASSENAVAVGQAARSIANEAWRLVKDRS
jgi:aminoglycoside phosphotransferase (APT) family kinase protein